MYELSDLKGIYEPILAANDAANAWSAEQAQKAMDWQEKMSNTAHQREVKDLLAAGLNPVLSAGGQGATTGSGIAASGSTAGVSAIYGLTCKILDAQIAQAQALQTSAQAVQDVSSSRDSGDGAVSSLLTQYSNPKAAELAEAQFKKDKERYGTTVAYELAETNDPWLREKIIEKAGKSGVGAFDNVLRDASAGILSKSTGNIVTRSSARQLVDKVADWLKKTFSVPAEKAAAELYEAPDEFTERIFGTGDPDRIGKTYTKRASSKKVKANPSRLART